MATLVLTMLFSAVVGSFVITAEPSFDWKILNTLETTTMNTLTVKIAEMLQENTGRSFLDSGGAYGRNWERNQGVDFESQPVGNLEFWNRNGELDIVPTLSVYHWLKDRLEYNPELDEQYRDYVEDLDIHTAEDFARSIDGKGIYGDGPAFTVNTYNGEDLLSQIIQYVYWTDGDGAHVLLQVHGGCDARGGYTDPVAFDVADHDGTSIFDNARASIFCECGKHWDADDGCHWAPDGCHDQTYLEDYPATEDRPEYPEPVDPNQLALFDDERKTPDAGVVWVEEDNGHCPHCGGVLNLAPWPA